MNKGKYYILPEGIKVEKMQVDMFKAGDGFAYQEERLAEYSVALGSVCECGNVIDGKSYTICASCREKKQNARYNALEEVIWDNETPLTIFNSDDYFWSTDDLESYCENEGVNVENLQLVLCTPNYPQTFDIQDHCEDVLTEELDIREYEKDEHEYSVSEIENIVNEFLRSQPISWSGGNKRVKLEEN